MSTKIEIFETIVHRLKDWYMEENKITSIEKFNQSNDFSILKLIKLHFFVTAINSNTDPILLDKFEFFAMPYGPVETDIYRKIKDNSSFSNFSINNFKTTFIDNTPSTNIDGAVNNSIDEAIITIKKIDSCFVNADAGSLVELTHKWDSWKFVYAEAVRSGIYSKKIEKDLIVRDNKILNLQLVC
ncbi:type II toxin-antitoxin system antitoxin SocA domain-containing protein [Flavobacterium sp. KACC 22761]|uniref:type II toxin-antitoxin system antitoxin SocA domain-containing protein n=1 Tax=Flavobacterium sp. KACC 22761 TaxID=3092665 RepID=UPI002A760400|nr:type II toxin-antitoxin system antitoxin SocA domain-containing protein [Flavobacterium sp. KACC 22761]WPO80029.1 DUF4065 domain-containing protein [Flavobacterium sp. KACC 22761]